MAIQTITYANKVAINQNADIPATNKVQDTDMNEIKSVVNNNAINIGDLSNLETLDKSSLVGAMNSIMEIGNNGNGTYIKFSNGILICFKKVNYSANANFTQDGTLYYKNISVGNFPIKFTETPTINIINEQKNSTRRVWLGGTFGVSVSGIQQINICTNWNASDAGGTLHIQAIGKWK